MVDSRGCDCQTESAIASDLSVLVWCREAFGREAGSWDRHVWYVDGQGWKKVFVFVLVLCKFDLNIFYTFE